MPEKLTASCQSAISETNSTTVGQYWRANAFIFMLVVHAHYSETDERVIGRQGEDHR